MREELKAREEERRERHWDPRARWKALQDTITWADAQVTCGRNSMAGQLESQAKILARRRSEY